MSIAVASKAKWTANKFGLGMRKLWTGGKYFMSGISFAVTLPFKLFALTITLLKYSIIFFVLLLLVTILVSFI